MARKITKSIRIDPELLQKCLEDCKTDCRDFGPWVCIAIREKIIRDRRQRAAIIKAKQEGAL